jgi:hypothetical protein
MRKVETLEAASERLNKPLLDEPDAKTDDEAVTKSQADTFAFLAKLKQRSKEKKEGFIQSFYCAKISARRPQKTRQNRRGYIYSCCAYACLPL